LQIPAIGVDTALIDLGLQRDGTLQVPPDGTRAGWFTGAPSPGERGPAVMTGHVDWAGHEGVFYDLRHLRVGARIMVARQDGSTAVFGVTGTQQVGKGTFPTRAVYDDVDHPALRLITCGGSFDNTAHSYRDNIVVFADLLTTTAR
jgi:sortase (surface protein transpeptidase)